MHHTWQSVVLSENLPSKFSPLYPVQSYNLIMEGDDYDNSL